MVLQHSFFLPIFGEKHSLFDISAMEKIEYWTSQLGLQPHPEGGFYAETYRAPGMTATARGLRPAGTAIYFLLTAGHFSAFHRIRSDEIWHHYEGDAVHIHVLDPNGGYSCLLLGHQPERGERLQQVVPAGAWFASECVGEQGYALTGCTVAPGFDFADFELAERSSLALEYPEHAPLIHRLTR